MVRKSARAPGMAYCLGQSRSIKFFSASKASSNRCPMTLKSNTLSGATLSISMSLSSPTDPLPSSLHLQLPPHCLDFLQHLTVRHEPLPHEHPPQGLLLVEAGAEEFLEGP